MTTRVLVALSFAILGVAAWMEDSGIRYQRQLAQWKAEWDRLYEEIRESE